MAVRNCCINNCNSCTERTEDIGVTYHKFPKDVTLRDVWITVTQHTHSDTELPMYVCSRHFYKSDFQVYKDSKYVLKSDAVPTIFPWDTLKSDKMEITNKSAEVGSEQSTLSSAKDDSENVDAIKKFIEEQEKEIQDRKNSPVVCMSEDTNSDNEKRPIEMASSVMDMILIQSEKEIKKKILKVRQQLTTIDKGNSSMSLSVGSKVEAKDFGEDWYPAQIVEVDYDDMEVLIHYDDDPKKHDEWISVSSPRLRPAGAAAVQPGPSTAESVADPPPVKEEVKETKADEKNKITFVVGERCLARWRDNRRFMATIQSDLGNGKYEIIFDDGCHWSCTTTRLYKLRPNLKELTVDPSAHSPTSMGSPGQYGAGPSDATQDPAALPPYHTHLFDPTRDYLGSKSERRERKRKLNIKEIFNIGQKKQKRGSPSKPAEKKPRVVKKKKAVKVEGKVESTAANAVASIIGTVNKEEPTTDAEEGSKDELVESKVEVKEETDITQDLVFEVNPNDDIDDIDVDDGKGDIDPVLKEEAILEKFDKHDEDKHAAVIDRIKEVINKLEDGLIQDEKLNSPKPAPKKEENEKIEPENIECETKASETKESETIELETKESEAKELEPTKPELKEAVVVLKPVSEPPKPEVQPVEAESPKKVKHKKGKKLKLLHEKKVKKQVEKVKNELEEMKRQVDEMRRQMMLKTQELAKGDEGAMMPDTFLLPGEWCAKWVNGQPIGTVSEIECETKVDPSGKPALPRRSVQVEDKRLPEGWTKHMVRRSLGHSAGKWDVVLVSPDNRRFHTKNEMRAYFENNPELALQGYDQVLTDFGVHLKLSRRMGWIIHTPDGATDGPSSPLPSGTISTTSPLVKRKKLNLKKKGIKIKQKRPRLTLKMKLPRPPVESHSENPELGQGPEDGSTLSEDTLYPALEDGYVYVGSLKVQIIENLLRCPAEGCFKNFRNNTLLQMHIKHYHRELRKMLGATPKVLDLAYARTMPNDADTRTSDQKTIKVKLPKAPKREELKPEPKPDIPEPVTPIEDVPIPRSQDSPKLRQALGHKPVKRPRVLLPVRRVDPEPEQEDASIDMDFEGVDSMNSPIELPVAPLDFEAEISTHTVTKPFLEKKRKVEKRRGPFVLPPKRPASEEDDWAGGNSDVETRSSFPRSGTPDSKVEVKLAPVSSESNNEDKDANMYMTTENGERIKIVHMKREEIINCHCGFREEDGLMVQCELCLCWQHALCHNIQRESEVPEKYTCSICLNPRRGRRSRRFVHDQDRLYEGLLPGARACDSLRRSHELAGNLLRIEDALHALTVKYYVSTKKDHPKLYLWAKDWEQLQLQYTQERLNSDYSDLNIMISDTDKENLPVKADDLHIDMATPLPEEHDRYSQREGQLGPQSLLSGLLASPGGASLDLPITTSELERLAKTVQEESERPVIRAPQPEAPIENSVCRQRLLKHIQRCQALMDARLDSIEAQVAELESQDPSFEDDETADYFPRTKQTVLMLSRDLNTMEELGVMT